MKKELYFKTFNEFCKRAYEIRLIFLIEIKLHNITYAEYRDYIYDNHFFSNNKNINETIKEKCWEWCLSLEYEPMQFYDLKILKYKIPKGW